MLNIKLKWRNCCAFLKSRVYPPRNLYFVCFIVTVRTQSQQSVALCRVGQVQEIGDVQTY